uniref:Protein kinase domain-containing protein n=1 Tax=Oryza brachyantha TaxID=4533 RepID=J3MGF4_ORYBR
MGSSVSSCCGSAEKVEQGCVSASMSSSTWRMFSYKELHAATNGFSEENKLGEGGFGSVYWGKTSDGLQIAVKKLKATNNSKAEMEFAVEVEVLARVRHKNLLGLRGYCAGAGAGAAEQRMIVYDYMPNLSLLSHLHGQFAADVQLDWRRRMDVAVGSAEGLVYLHHEVAPHIIHRDIKASNVLLDSDFAPLVADFGFAKLVPEGVSHMTTRVKGTLGYLAPEYAMWGKVSESCDVYSFGVLLLELASARRPLEKLPGGVKREIVQWAAPLAERRKWDRLADPRRVVEAAALCVQGEPDRRPDMRVVVSILRGDADAAAGAGTKKDQPVRIKSIKYADHLMEMDKSSVYYGDDDDDEEGDIDDDEEVEEYSLMDDKSSMNFGVFGAMPVHQTMQDPYVKSFGGEGGIKN